MKKRKLGQHGPEVSAIAYGAMSFGGFYGPTSRAESFATLDAVWEMGIDFLDTSNIYGPYTSEEVIGAWTADRGKRFKIATKGGIVIGAPRGTVDWLRVKLRLHAPGDPHSLSHARSFDHMTDCSPEHGRLR